MLQTDGWDTETGREPKSEWKVKGRSGFTGYQSWESFPKGTKFPEFWPYFILRIHGSLLKITQLPWTSCPIPSVPHCWSARPQETHQSSNVQCQTNDRWLLQEVADLFHQHYNEGHTSYLSLNEQHWRIYRRFKISPCKSDLSSHVAQKPTHISMRNDIPFSHCYICIGKRIVQYVAMLFATDDKAWSLLHLTCVCCTFWPYG